MTSRTVHDVLLDVGFPKPTADFDLMSQYSLRTTLHSVFFLRVIVDVIPRIVMQSTRGCSSAGRASDRLAAEAGSDSPVWQGIFLSESTFSADSLTKSAHPRVQPRALNLCTR